MLLQPQAHFCPGVGRWAAGWQQQLLTVPKPEAPNHMQSHGELAGGGGGFQRLPSSSPSEESPPHSARKRD